MAMSKKKSATKQPQLDKMLIKAARSGNDSAVLNLISIGANVDAIDPADKCPILSFGMYTLKDDTIDALISKSNNLTATYGFQWTLLHTACKAHRDVSTIKKLHLSGIDINTRTGQGYTPLHVAASGGSGMHIIKYLVENGTDLNARDENGLTALQRLIVHTEKTFMPINDKSTQKLVSCMTYLIENGAVLEPIFGPQCVYQYLKALTEASTLNEHIKNRRIPKGDHSIGI